MLDNANLLFAIIILVFIVLLGICFDMLGVAMTAADVQPFHSMSAHKERGGKEAVQLLNNASQVSSIFCDVVGDICGIISGSTATVIVAYLLKAFTLPSLLASISITSLISALTIGGKAVGKEFAIANSTQIVHFVAKIMNKLHIQLKKK